MNQNNSKFDDNSRHLHLGFFLNIMLAFLSYLIPKKSNQILIGCRYCERFSGNPKFFFLYMYGKQKDFQVIWITANKKLFLELQGKKLPSVFLYSFKGFKTILRSTFLIFDHNIRGVSYSFFLPGKFYKIEIWHGVSGIKKMDLRIPQKFRLSFLYKIIEKVLKSEINSYLATITCSESWRKKYAYVFPYEKTMILGYPRNDVFFERDLLYNDYKLHLEAYDKVILYCPTFREDLSPIIPFSKNFLEKLNEYLKRKNYILLDKRHPNEQIIKNYPKYSNIKYIPQVEDIQELLVQTDILITDYSSVFMDFCLTGKPIIFYPYDFKEYNASRGMEMNYFDELPGPFARNEKELMECLVNIEKVVSSDNYQNKYYQLRTKNHHYQDGKSCERLYRFLLTSLPK